MIAIGRMEIVKDGASFATVRTSGNQDLVPEESTAFNLGFLLEPIDDLSIELDYWSFDFTDLIQQHWCVESRAASQLWSKLEN
jgi:outer membrane receptor protein involved in Fe transport